MFYCWEMNMEDIRVNWGKYFTVRHPGWFEQHANRSLHQFCTLDNCIARVFSVNATLTVSQLHLQ